jgi:hypothetical protein
MILAGILLMFLSLSPIVNALTFNPSRIIDDSVFDNVQSMDITDINNFLNSFPNSCISPNSGFSSVDPIGYTLSSGFTYSQNGPVTAGQVIYDAAEAYGLNPQVLLSTLQKEQGIIDGSGPYGCGVLALAGATGYGCLDSGGTYSYTNVYLYTRSGTTYTSVSGTCVDTGSKIGFSQQVIHAAWLLKFAQQRSLGNINWDVQATNFPEQGDVWDNSDDLQSCYSGPMTPGTFQICPSGPSIYYDGYTTIDNVSTEMETGATAALYYYTPHFNGNEDFFNIWTSWFGSPITGECLFPSMTNVSSSVAFSKENGIANPNFIIDSGSATNCVEFHEWTTGMNTWRAHIASNLAGINTSNAEIEYADLNGDGQDVPILVVYADTTSGMVEFHVWNPGMQSWADHIASNLPTSQFNPQYDSIEFADLTGRGYDQAILVEGGDTASGMVEFHVWNPGMQSWQVHIASNYPTSLINTKYDSIEFANLTGTGYDQAILVEDADTASGMVEFHVWLPWMQSWQVHIASNFPTSQYNPADFQIQFADISGHGYDQAILIGLENTSTGNIEFHVWNPWMQSWEEHIASNEETIP